MSKISNYLISVSYWDEETQYNEKYIVSSFSYNEAVNVITKYIGQDKIDSIKIKLFGKDIMFIPEDIDISSLEDAQIW